MRKKKMARPTPLAPYVWSGAPVLRAARQLNERSLALLSNAAQASPSAPSSPAVATLREFGKHLDNRAYERMSRCPVLLVDLNFQQPEWWESIANNRRESQSLNRPTSVFVMEEAPALLHEILIEAWGVGRTLPRVVSLLFGMAFPVANTIAQLSVTQIDRIAADHARDLRPRWEGRRTFWRQLLQSAIGTDDEALIDVQLYCLTLLGSDRVL